MLVDRACELAGLAAGASVLEIGCGSGQLTRSLVARGLRVVAVEPGERLIARARERLSAGATERAVDGGDVRFVHARLEDAVLSPGCCAAVFSASAIHWIDPDIGWRRIADALGKDGTVALLSYFGLEDPRSAGDQQALRASLVEVAPNVAADWPRYRTLDAIRDGSRIWGEDISQAWAWLGGHDVARGYVRELFADVRLATVPLLVEQTADQLNDLLGTMSFWARLSPGQRDRLRAANRALHGRLGRPIRSSIVACLVTARRRRDR